jgi:hypothetical protein
MEVPSTILLILIRKKYLPGSLLKKQQNAPTRIASTNKEKKIFSFIGDLKRMSTSIKTIMENRNIKK